MPLTKLRDQGSSAEPPDALCGHRQGRHGDRCIKQRALPEPVMCHRMMPLQTANVAPARRDRASIAATWPPSAAVGDTSTCNNDLLLLQHQRRLCDSHGARCLVRRCAVLRPATTIVDDPRAAWSRPAVSSCSRIISAQLLALKTQETDPSSEAS